MTVILLYEKVPRIHEFDNWNRFAYTVCSYNTACNLHTMKSHQIEFLYVREFSQFVVGDESTPTYTNAFKEIKRRSIYFLDFSVVAF